MFKELRVRRGKDDQAKGIKKKKRRKKKKKKEKYGIYGGKQENIMI
jgi:hypothetical protein